MLFDAMLVPVGKRGRMILAPYGVDDDGEDIENNHHHKHLVISKGGNQCTGNSAAHSDPDIVGTKES